MIIGLPQTKTVVGELGYYYVGMYERLVSSRKAQGENFSEQTQILKASYDEERTPVSLRVALWISKAK
jgi:hypothetical protein